MKALVYSDGNGGHWVKWLEFLLCAVWGDLFIGIVELWEGVESRKGNESEHL